MKAIKIVGKAIKWYLISDVAFLAAIGASEMLRQYEEDNFFVCA